jgi:hypothetical protein
MAHKSPPGWDEEPIARGERDEFALQLALGSDAREIVRARSRFDAPRVKSDRIKRSMETDGSPPSIFATRDWLERSSFAQPLENLEHLIGAAARDAFTLPEDFAGDVEILGRGVRSSDAMGLGIGVDLAGKLVADLRGNRAETVRLRHLRAPIPWADLAPPRPGR